MVPVDLLTDAYLSITQKSLDEILQPITSKKGPVDVVVSYQGFDLKSGLEENYSEKLKDLEKRHYKSVKRYSNQAFRPSKLRSKSSVEAWDEHEMFNRFDENGNGEITPEELRGGLRKLFGLRLKQWEMDKLCREKITIQSKCVENLINIDNGVHTYPLKAHNQLIIAYSVYTLQTFLMLYLRHYLSIIMSTKAIFSPHITPGF